MLPDHLPILRQLLSAIEAKPSSFKPFLKDKSGDELRVTREILSLASNARLFTRRRSAFREYEELTTAGREFLVMLRDDGACTRVRQQLQAEGVSVELSDLKVRLTKASSAAPITTAHRASVFLVHGHDHEAREQTTIFLERMGIDVIALDEQHNAGKTVIEKFEGNTDVNFAVVLLTEDDVGGKSPDKLLPRPRQNVVFELGFFMGRMRRDRVCAIRKGNVELPSDISGLVWLSFDGRWKRDLANELEKAGYQIDWKKLAE